jgi:hypothetical protein
MSHDASLLSSAPEDMLQFLVSASDHLNRNHRMRRDQMAPKRAARSVMSAASTRWRAQRSFSQFKGELRDMRPAVQSEWSRFALCKQNFSITVTFSVSACSGSLGSLLCVRLACTAACR